MLSKQLSPNAVHVTGFQRFPCCWVPTQVTLSICAACKSNRKILIYLHDQRYLNPACPRGKRHEAPWSEMRWDVWFAFTRQRCHRASLASKLGQQSIPSVKFIRKSTFSKHLNKSKHVLSSVTTCFLFILCILSIMCPDPLIHSMIILLLFSHCEDHTATNYHVLHYTTFGH